MSIFECVFIFYIQVTFSNMYLFKGIVSLKMVKCVISHAISNP